MLSAFDARDATDLAALVAQGAVSPDALLDASLDRNEDGQTLVDTLADEDTPDPATTTQAHEVERLLETWIATLNRREREVLDGRFGLHHREPETLDTLSERLGLSPELIRAALQTPASYDKATFRERVSTLIHMRNHL